MRIKFFKLILILLFYYTPVYSKNQNFNEFSLSNLSNYFSGIVAYDNKNNTEALSFFKSSKTLIKQHSPYLEKFIYSLVLEGNVLQATNEIKINLNKNNSNFFEAHLILALDSLKKKNYKKSKEHLQKSYKFINNNKVSLIIFETLKQYLYVFEENKFPEIQNKFGSFSFINKVFQACYLNDKNTQSYFENLVYNSGADISKFQKDNLRNKDSDYSRYIYFYLGYLTEQNRFDETKEITNNLDYLNLSLLISQGKKWVENQKFNEFKKIFSCRKSNDIISEFLFLIANLYSSQKNYEQSNFYLNISYYFNPKFLFNLSLLAENHYLNKDYLKTAKILKVFKKKDQFYYWFKLKKEAQIISKEENYIASLKFISSKFKNIKDPSLKIIFDFANFNKNAKKYKEAIRLYNHILLKIDDSSPFYNEVLFRRGGSYERIGDYKNSDKDLLKSLEINPDDAYVLNYLAYSWLEREYKIEVALEMLKKAYEKTENDAYIIDSIGWAHYLMKDYVKAEDFLKRAVELMPEDPTVNDHYADILWKLDRKIQARYFWKSVLKLEETEDEMRKNILSKLSEVLENS